MKLFAKMMIASLVLSSQAYAAGAADWSCVSDKARVTGDFEVSMFGQIVTIHTRQRSGHIVDTTYFTDETEEGFQVLMQDDPNQPDLQQLAGTFGEQKADIALNKREARKYDVGFLFLGRTFMCVRN